MTAIGRLCRTVRYLRPIQILGRFRFHLLRPELDFRPAPPLSKVRGTWISPAQRAVSLLGPGRLQLIGLERDLDEIGWDNPATDRLWRYNLHYLDDLNARDAELRRTWHQALITRWIAENPQGVGTGWEPYPLSLRVINWIKWHLGGVPPRADFLDSLAAQLRWLSGRIEWHLLGNHLFANAKALVFGGLYFESEESRRWLAKGLKILRAEIPEQILPDGGHFERSSMYHALAFEDMLDLLNIIRALATPGSPAKELESLICERSSAMLNVLRSISHPDGDIGQFNDASREFAPPNTELESYATRLGVHAQQLPRQGILQLDASGYVRVACGPVLAILDVAPLGPDYLLGHAHADTLSFEVSKGAKRVIVNGGTSCYGTGPQRQRERGTAWHSTVEVARQNSSEVWSGFRVGRRARIIERDVRSWTVVGAHDGYCFLPGAPVHRRSWVFSEQAMSVSDTISAAQHSAIAYFHLAPGLLISSVGSAKEWKVYDDQEVIAVVEILAGRAHCESSVQAPKFGQLVPSQILEVALLDGQAVTRWNWA